VTCRLRALESQHIGQNRSAGTRSAAVIAVGATPDDVQKQVELCRRGPGLLPTVMARPAIGRLPGGSQRLHATGAAELASRWRRRNRGPPPASRIASTRRGAANCPAVVAPARRQPRDLATNRADPRAAGASQAPARSRSLRRLLIHPLIRGSEAHQRVTPDDAGHALAERG